MGEFTKIIYLPIEIVKRELDSKIHLMKKIVLKENFVVIGHHGDAVADHLKPGLYFYKDHAGHSIERFRKFKIKGWKIAALDEEGLIIGTEEEYKDRADKAAMREADIIYSWGKKQYEIIKDEGVEILQTGHFRFDYFKENSREFKKEKLISVLINTRFVETNSILGNKEFYNSAKYWLGKMHEDDESFYRRYNVYLSNEKKIYKEFLKIITLLDGDKDIERVVIRPHPMENHSTYVKLVKNLCKTTMSKNRYLIDDFKDADLIIHDACTTAVEGAAMGLPVYSLRPNIEGPVYGGAINEFSIKSTSADELIKKLKIKLNQIPSENINEYVYNFKKQINASELIVKNIEALNINEIKINKISDLYSSTPPLFLWGRLRYGLELFISKITKNINKSLLPEFLSMINYSKAKYDLTYKEICSRVMLQLDDQLPQVYISKIGINSYVFSKNKIDGAHLIFRGKVI